MANNRIMCSRYEALQKMHINEKQLETLIKRGDLEVIQDGKNQAFHIEDIETLMGTVKFQEEFGPKKPQHGTTPNDRALFALHEVREALLKLREAKFPETNENVTLYHEAISTWLRTKIDGYLVQLDKIDNVYMTIFLTEGMVLGVTPLFHIITLRQIIRDRVENYRNILERFAIGNEEVRNRLEVLIKNLE